MRITNNVLINNLKRNLSIGLRNMDKYQTQLATGRRINKPSDDPSGIVDSLRLKSHIRQNKQFQDNAEDAISWLNSTDEALGSLTETLNRVYELTVYGGNGALAAEDRQAISAETKQLIEEVKSIANTYHGDRYIFGGTNTKEVPYAGDATWNHNNNEIKYEIGVGTEIPINTTAQEVFIEKDLMGTLDSIVSHLDSNNTEALSGEDISKLQANLDQILASQAHVGARVNRLELTKTRLEEQEINFTKLLSEVEGADAAQVIMELKNQENVYKAALSVGSRVIMPTLIDFLR